ncbi:MAG: fibronectin/fibrinogen-binding protein [Clostridiales bacterium]|nr:fibronectin/fibrinogen-binding protein [Clostridiales bacterium]
MAYDGVLLNCVIAELRDKILNGRIEKIYQPEKDEIHLHIRTRQGSVKLLLSASANHPRIHLIESSKPNPFTPPMFCMLLRKHLLGGRIVDIIQPGFDRIAEIIVENINEMGDLAYKRLIIEIMGRHSNIILVDDACRIIDSIKHVNETISSVRQVLPGKSYESPPSQGKRNPLEQTQQSLASLFKEAPLNKKAEGVIAESFTGVSRATATEIVYRALRDDSLTIQNIDTEKLTALYSSFIGFFEDVSKGQFYPAMLINDDGNPRDIFPFIYTIYPERMQRHYSSVSEMLEMFYSERDKNERMKQRSSHILKVIKTNMERCQKKLAIQLEELQEAKDADKFRLWGELITANLHTIPNGVSEVTVVNYYDPDGKTITIPMDNSKTPVQNAQQYYKKYSKAKNAVEMLKKQVSESREELTYLEGLLDSLDRCTDESDLEEIRLELMEQGYIKKTGRNKKHTQVPSKPYHFVSSDGFDIYVGKNNHQNDQLTLKTAAHNDIWLHTKNIPGSHVIIKTEGRQVPERTLIEAGMLAAYFSKGRESSRVPVDYCPRKNVKKPNGARPGMVIYERYNTLYVTPSEEEIKKLKQIS